MTAEQKAIALLSGGLDSTVALAWAVREYEVRRAVFVGYAHNALKAESTAVAGIARHYEVEVANVGLPFYVDLCQSFAALNEGESLDGSQDEQGSPDELRRVWVPNRNMVFVSIAAAFAESLGCEAVVAGFNAEEAEQFPDNSFKFVKRVNEALELSTLSRVRLVCPLIELRKPAILEMGIELGAPLSLVYSCYEGKEKMCGECMSCLHLKSALSELWERQSLSPEVRAKLLGALGGRFIK